MCSTLDDGTDAVGIGGPTSPPKSPAFSWPRTKKNFEGLRPSKSPLWVNHYMRENTLRDIWQRGGCALNGWLHIPNAFATELMAHQGWDSLTIDLQHGVVDYGAALGMLQAIATTSTIPLARVPWNEPGIIMKMLDAGCFGIICPMINTRAECEAFVGACRYPPRGYRSFGPLRAALYAGSDYAARADQIVITMAMIETRQAVENVEEIVQTPGLDALYIGPADLGQSLGFGAKMDPTEPEVIAAIDHILDTARRYSVVVGMHTGSAEYARRMAAKGMQLLTIGSDARLLAGVAQRTVMAFRDTADSPTATVY
jgi:4-hydroxy-2-oxoheptanedioate aldolase